MKRVTVTLGDEDAFFARGKTIAALADAGKPIPNEWIISFGDPADLLKMLTPARLELIGALKSGPSSITAISDRLHRDRSSVSKDVEQLQVCGLLKVVQKVLPGHGKQKEVSLTAPRMQLQAMLT
jgi:predicted transcriptional regulator